MVKKSNFSSASIKFLGLGISLVALIVTFNACGRLWGGLSRSSGSSGGSTSTNNLGMFYGAVGRMTASTGTCPAGAAASSWCSGGTPNFGTTDGMYSSPFQTAVDSTNGYIFIADYANHRVVKINMTTGAFIGAIGRTTATTGTCPAAGAAPGWCTGGTFASGSSDGMYSGPAGVAYDSTNGILFISDNNNHRVVKVTASTGAFVGAIGSSTASTGSCPAGAAAPGWCTGGTFALGNGDGMYRLPRDIAVDVANDALYIADGTNHRFIKVTASTGAFVGMIGEMFASTGTCPNGGIAAGWCTGGLPISGSADGSFNQTRGVVIDTTSGYLYVTDQNNHKISKILASTGAFVGAVGRTSATAGTCPAAGATTGWCTGGTFTSGAADGMYNTLNGLMVDSANNSLFAADLSNHRIARINLATGVFVGAIGNTSASTGTCPTTGAASIWCTGGTFASAASDGAFSGPGGLSLDLLTGYLYVSDSGNSRIVRVR